MKKKIIIHLGNVRAASTWDGAEGPARDRVLGRTSLQGQPVAWELRGMREPAT